MQTQTQFQVGETLVNTLVWPSGTVWEIEVDVLEHPFRDSFGDAHWDMVLVKEHGKSKRSRYVADLEKLSRQ
jgi:hypothetical protein